MTATPSSPPAPPPTRREAAIARLTRAYEANNIPVDRYTLKCVSAKPIHEVEALADHWEARKAQADREAQSEESSPHPDDQHILNLGTKDMARRLSKMSTHGYRRNPNIGRSYAGIRQYHGETGANRSSV